MEALLSRLRNYAFRISVGFLQCVVCYSTKTFFLDSQQFFPQLTNLFCFSGIWRFNLHIVPSI